MMNDRKFAAIINVNCETVSAYPPICLHGWASEREPFLEVIMLLYSEIQTEIQNRVIDSDGILDSTWFDQHFNEAIYFLITESGGGWLYDEDTFTTTEDSGESALSSEVLLILNMVDTTNRNPLDRILTVEELWGDPDRSTSGTPRGYFGTYHREVKAQPAAAGAISIVSSSASDITQKVSWRGKVSGEDRYESITITGTVAASGTLTPTLVKGMRLDAVAVGVVTVTVGAVTLATFAPGERIRQYPWIRFNRLCGGEYSMRYAFLRHPMPCTQSGYDFIDIPKALHDCFMLRYEELAWRAFTNNNMADKILQKNIELIKRRVKFLNQKPDQFTVWGGARQGNDFLTDVYLNNLP